MITVYGFSPSGNCHKVRLLLEHLGCEYRWIEVRTDDGSTRSQDLLEKNPNGKVPFVELEDGRVLAESNAILCWLADSHPERNLLPSDPWQRAQALSWMFFEQYSHEPCIAVARFICGWTPLDAERRAELPRLRERGHQALAVMERHLSAASWFTGEACGIADIALFAYTSVSNHGGIHLDAYPAIRDWLARVARMPAFVSLPSPDARAQALIDQST